LLLARERRLVRPELLDQRRLVRIGGRRHGGREHGEREYGDRGYSDLSAITGSTPAARRAGAQQASSDTPPSSATTPTYVTTSPRDTPYRSVSRRRLAALAPATPSTAPIAVSAR